MKYLYEKYVDNYAMVIFDGIDVEVICIDVRILWGREQVKVKAIYGQESVWVISDRVRLIW